MPKKIGFTVVSSSGHDENFSANELLVHAPTVNGWRSARLCSYPQHITLQLAERSRVRKIQLLAHQYLISSKVEFHIGDTLPETQSPGLHGQLHRLGYVSLSDNEKTSFNARELKSVHVDAIGTYLRITLHRNHTNRFNPYNQVALVAINVLGDSLNGNDLNTIPSREQMIEHYLNNTQLETALDGTYMGKCDSISPLDDLAFDMYQHPEVAHIIRLLDQKKQEMVHQERFEVAKSLKQAIADLHKVGEHLGRYDVEKSCAIEEEDFDLAQKKKEQMEAYRMAVYQQLEVHNLLDMTTITRAAPEAPAAHEPAATPKAPVPSQTFRRGRRARPPRGQVAEQVPTAPQLATPPESRQATAHIPPTPARIDVASVPNDERPLPVLQRKGRALEVAQSPAEERPLPADTQGTPHSRWGSGPTSGPEPLTEKAQRDASLPIDVYGESLVTGAYSKIWCYRVDALLAVYQKLLESSNTMPKEELRNLIRAGVFLARKGLLDKVSSVFLASIKLLRLLLSQLIPGAGVGRAEVSHCLEQTWPNLLARSGDAVSRIRTTAAAFIQDIALLKEVRALQVIPIDLVKPYKSNFPTRLAQSQAELLEKLLAELGTDNSGFTLDNVMKFCTAALEHSASAVRDVAIRIVMAMYQRHKGAVLHYLPANDAATRKNVLYKNIFDGFARIDGKLVEDQTLKKGGGMSVGQKEKEEICSLQEQLAALKEISGKEINQGQTQKRGVEKPADTKATVTKVADRVDNQPSVANYLDNLCIFCGKKDESFTEDGLDLHYWKHCPMLQRCDECRQVVEIASLMEHLVVECESRARFSQCPRCSEAVPTEELAHHTQGISCNPPDSGKVSNHCPLCHINFVPGEEAWKAHLMGREGCEHNSRRTVLYQGTQPAQGMAACGAKLKASWSVGARGKPPGRGSRILALVSRAGAQAGRHMPGKR